MNYRVYKYATKPGVFELELPVDAEGLYFHADPMQIPCLWVRLDIDAPKVKCVFVVVGTGHPAPEPEQSEYVGSCMGQGGRFIWHLFQVYGRVDHLTNATWGDTEEMR